MFSTLLRYFFYNLLFALLYFGLYGWKFLLSFNYFVLDLFKFVFNF